MINAIQCQIQEIQIFILGRSFIPLYDVII